MTFNIPNLPLGVTVTKLRASCAPEEFELVGDHREHKIYKGGRPAGTARVIVEPAKGWRFAFDLTANCYRCAKEDAPEMVKAEWPAQQP
jgi:hypothetical protein